LPLLSARLASAAPLRAVMNNNSVAAELAQQFGVHLRASVQTLAEQGGVTFQEQTPLERTFQNLVGGWGAGGAVVHDGGEVHSGGDPVLSGFEDWEALLRDQNAANDELCSENGRLRAEIERLQSAELATEDASSGGGLGTDGSKECFEPELLDAVLVAVHEVLAMWVSGPALQCSVGSGSAGVSPPADALRPGSCLPELSSIDSKAATDMDTPDAVDENMQAPATEDVSEPSRPVVGALAAADALEASRTEVAVSMEGDTLKASGAKHNVLPQRTQLQDGVSSDACAWRTVASAAVDAAVRQAFCEASDSATPAPALSPEEETAVLVGEKIALRELVEKQQERISALEQELQEAGAVAIGGALSSAISGAVQGLSDAHGALSAGLSAVRATKEKRPIATVGLEYEVVGRRGTIVRNGESLRSDVVTELPPGSRVRVVSTSEKYPRRVEIVSVRMPGVAETLSPPGVSGVVDVDGCAVTTDATPTTVEAGAAVMRQPCETAVAATLVEVNSREVTADVRVPVIGWISASAKDGRMLIRPAPQEAGDAVVGGTGAGAEPEGREEGGAEIACVTLSTEEWQCLHQAHEAAMARVGTLTMKLNQMGSELLQSFEMKSVLGELRLVVQRSQEKCFRMREIAAMTTAEVEQRRWGECTEHTKEALDEAPPGDHSPGAGSEAASRPGSQGDGLSPTAALEGVDWDRLVSERETTAASLSVALQRLACLEREVEELRGEQEAVDGRGHGELGGLRATLRRLAKPTMAAVSRVLLPGFLAAPNPSDNVADVADQGLYRHRMEELQNHVASLQAELSRASASEVALRRSVEARRSAIRELLHQGATADLNVPVCGPLRLPASRDAERRALQLAVEEQLSWNLSLCGQVRSARPAQVYPHSSGSDTRSNVAGPRE